MKKMNFSREQLIALRHNYSPAQHRDYWTPEERQELEDMYYAGYGISEMAIHFNRSECAIYNQLELMGLFKKTRKAKNKPKNVNASVVNAIVRTVTGLLQTKYRLLKKGLRERPP